MRTLLLRAERIVGQASRWTRALPLAVVAGVLSCVISANAIIVDFGEYQSGTIIDSEYATSGADNTNSGLAPGYGFTVSVTGGGSAPDIGVFYDSNRTGGDDADLEGGLDGAGFAGGNLDGTPQGNLLIVQERASATEISTGNLTFANGQSVSSTANAPDDNAYGGVIAFTFEQGLVEFGFDWVDLDSAEDASITFIDTLSGKSASLDFNVFIDTGSDFYQPSVVFGDHTANRIAGLSVDTISNSSQVAWTGSGGGPTTFNQVVFDLKGSGAVSALSFTPVPEISTVAGGIALVGFVGCGLVRRRRQDCAVA